MGSGGSNLVANHIPSEALRAELVKIIFSICKKTFSIKDVDNSTAEFSSSLCGSCQHDKF